MSSKSASTATEAGPNWFNTSRSFLNEVKAELRKVRWPDMEETQKGTLGVLYVTAVVAAVLGAIDYGLSLVVAQIFS